MNKNIRINKFDNIKGLGIFLIVLCHMCFLTSFQSVKFIHNFVFIIHLPLFFFVAGYFSKIGPDEPIKAFKRLLIPYIIFCIIYELFSIFVLGNPRNTMLFIKPGYELWFLVSLFTMKLLLPIFNRLKYPVLTAFILALLIGFIECDVLGISRTFAYLPIFLIGFNFNDYKDKFDKKYYKLSNMLDNKSYIWILLVLTLMCCVIVAYYVPFKAIFLKYPYSAKNISNILIRAVILALGIINTLIINRLMTNNSNIFTKFGRNSLAVYLLHIYFIVILRITVKSYFLQHEMLYIAFVICISFAITYLLSRNLISKYLNTLFEGVFNLISRS